MGLDILIAGLIAVTGPALEVATGRLLAEEDSR